MRLILQVVVFREIASQPVANLHSWNLLHGSCRRMSEVAWLTKQQIKSENE